MKNVLRGLVLLPFVQYLFIGQNIATSLALGGITFVFLAFLFFLKSSKEKVKIAFPYLWLWVFLRTMWINGRSLFSGENLHVSLIFFLHISVFFLLYYIVVFSKIESSYITKPLGYACILISAYCILQHFGIDHFKFDKWPNPGTLGNPVNTAMYLAVTSPFLLQLKRGWVYFCLPITASILLASASALMGILAVVVTILTLRRYWGRLFILIVSILSIVIFKFELVRGFFYSQTKPQLWILAMRDWMNEAWFGKGLGNFQFRYAFGDSTTIGWRFMHNHYLYILYTLGIVGFIFLVHFLYSIKGRETLPLASVGSVLVMSLCSVPMRVYPIVLLTAFNLGVLTKGGVDEENPCPNVASINSGSCNRRKIIK